MHWISWVAILDALQYNTCSDHAALCLIFVPNNLERCRFQGLTCTRTATRACRIWTRRARAVTRRTWAITSRRYRCRRTVLRTPTTRTRGACTAVLFSYHDYIHLSTRLSHRGAGIIIIWFDFVLLIFLFDFAGSAVDRPRPRWSRVPARNTIRSGSSWTATWRWTTLFVYLYNM